MRSHELNRRTFVTGMAAAAALGLTTSLGAAPAAADTSAGDTVAARRKVFGAANVDALTGSVDPSKVILSWFGVTGYALAIGGTVVLLDAWIPRGTHAPVVSISARELADLRPTHIFIGHGHFDHAADAPEIAALSGATVVGTRVHVDTIAAGSAEPLAQHVVSDDSELLLDGGVTVRVIEHRHSQLRPPYGSPETVMPPPDFGRTLEHPPTPEDLTHLCSHLGDPEGGSLLYQFRIGDFVLTWHDTSGPLRSDAPHILDTLAALPASTVQVGAVQGFNQYTNGLQDPLDYIEALRPSIFVPSHHDNWMAPVSAPAAEYEPFLRAALGTLPNAPSMRLLTDPGDYLRPEALTFDL